MSVPVPPGPPRPTRVGSLIGGFFVGVLLSLFAAVVFGMMIAASPAVGIGMTIAVVGGLLVFQVRRWRRATDFQRGLLFGQIFCALVAGACFAMLMNLKIR